jgi:acetyl-CoA C-acetyltransferase
MSKNVFIVAAQRTPIGAFLGTLSTVPAVKLGGIALKAALEQAKLEVGLIEEVIIGNVISANLGQSPASQVAFHAGLNSSTACTLVNKVCASGMKAVMLATQIIKAGDKQIVAAGGIENMSLAPFFVPSMRTGYKYGSTVLEDAIQRDGLQDAYEGYSMGICGEACAEKYKISRESQDDFCIRSYELANTAVKAGTFKHEIAPVTIKGKKGDTVISEDEEPAKVIYDKIKTLKPAFKENGTITAANSSKINDGAAALILASEEAVKAHNLKPLARIVSYADAALDPLWFTIAPADAMPKALKNAGLTLKEIDCVEINEAFAVVPLANMQIMDIPLEKVNVLGGAVALGHPIGMSGSRVIMTLINALEAKKGRYGIASICNGGGGASAIIIEKV